MAATRRGLTAVATLLIGVAGAAAFAYLPQFAGNEFIGFRIFCLDKQVVTNGADRHDDQQDGQEKTGVGAKGQP